ncbi:sodium:alanine symporter family protein [Bacillus tianshenii]|nr:sodium:alanine symporter family protein [Bacillus tianshenii]
MQKVIDLITSFSSWIWGPPLVIFLTVSGLFLAFRLGFFHLRYAGYIFGQTFGKVLKKPKGKGTVSPFQALTSALASTIGAGNIIGVPAAIMFGGPGAIFWMWVIALIGMVIKFAESVLAVHYREKNEDGEYIGGPMYYMTKGLNMKWLGVWFAIALMVEIIPSSMVQGNAVASAAEDSFNLPPIVTGIIMAVLVGVVVLGGIQRIGTVMEKVVPFMAIFYVGAVIVIFFMNLGSVPEVFGLIFTHAFQPLAPVGGFTGATIAATIRWGFARGLYSNESGIGTAPIAHASATTDHPVRQGLWALTGVVIDTLIICSATAFVILSSGVWKNSNAMDDTSGLTTNAFAHYFGSAGGMVLTGALVIFVVSTLIMLAYYGGRQAEFLMGRTAKTVMKFVYLISIIIGSIGGAKVLWQFLDFTLAAVVIPNIIALLLLSNVVVKLKNEFFHTEGKYYQKDVHGT